MGFGQVDDAGKTKGWLLQVIVIVDSALRLIDGFDDLIQAAIKQVYFAGRSLYPRASINPRAPVVEAGDDWLGRSNRPGRAAQLIDRKRVGSMIVQPDIDIRIGSSGTSGMGAPDYYRRNTGNLSNMVEE